MASAVGVVSTRQSHRSEAVLVLVAAFVMALFGQASAQVEQEWAARYNGPGNSTDGAAAMVDFPTTSTPGRPNFLPIANIVAYIEEVRGMAGLA